MVRRAPECQLQTKGAIVARYGAGMKAETRQRIIETAGRRFKRDGINGSGITALMADAGLTNGAFYAHFESKDDLVANVVADQLRVQHARLASLPASKASLEDFVHDYLGTEHRDNPSSGCPSAALLDEISRCGDTIQASYTQGVRSVVDAIAAHLSPRDPSVAGSRAVGVFTVLVATLQLARAVDDRELSDAILDSGIRNAQILSDL